jgi:hypothetical protein
MQTAEKIINSIVYVAVCLSDWPVSRALQNKGTFGQSHHIIVNQTKQSQPVKVWQKQDCFSACGASQ